MATRRQRVTLEVDFEDNGSVSEPATWNWVELIDAPAMVVDFQPSMLVQSVSIPSHADQGLPDMSAGALVRERRVGTGRRAYDRLGQTVDELL